MLFIVLAAIILYYGSSFLIPAVIAAILSMLFLPVCRKLENLGLNGNVAIVICIFFLLLMAAGLFALISWQIADLSENSAQIKKQLNEALQTVQSFIHSKLGISQKEQQEFFREQQKNNTDLSGIAGKVMSSISGGFVNIILILVYIFLMLNMRRHIFRFVLKLVPAEDEAETAKIVTGCTKVVQKYLGGLAMMIVMLWVMYGIGFSIAGVRNPIFFAVLCGILEIVPFVGNITGTTLTVIVALTQGSGSGVVIGVLVTYGLVQFIQTYMIEPLVVGSEVNINPLFTIMSLVLFELVWGVGGMVLAIPLVGMIKIVCDHVPALKPYGFLIGKEKSVKGDSSMVKRIKKLFGMG